MQNISIKQRLHNRVAAEKETVGDFSQQRVLKVLQVL
jgi:hypothetical protein